MLSFHYLCLQFHLLKGLCDATADSDFGAAGNKARAAPVKLSGAQRAGKGGSRL